MKKKILAIIKMMIVSLEKALKNIYVSFSKAYQALDMVHVLNKYFQGGFERN